VLLLPNDPLKNSSNTKFREKNITVPLQNLRNIVNFSEWRCYSEMSIFWNVWSYFVVEPKFCEMSELLNNNNKNNE